MKTIKSVLIGALVALLGSSAQAASQTVNTNVKVDETKTGITSSSNVTDSKRNWSGSTAADSSVATVSLTSSSNVKKPTISVKGVGAGYTTYVAKNNATSGTDKNYTFTCNITVTDSKDETVTLEPRGSVQKTCTYSGKYKQGTTDGNWSATTTDGSVATVSSVSGSAAEVTPTITAGSKIGTATVTVKNAYVTYTYTVEVKEPKRVVSGQTLSFPSTKNVTANWYYRVVSADGDSVGVSPAEATQQGGQTAPVEIEVEGLDVTESPVTITLQQRQSFWGNFSDVETFEVVVTEPPFVDYGTNTVVIAKGKTSDALSVESAASAQWKFWSENTSVATVSKATGATATKSDNFTITAVDTESKSTYCVASNKYAKYTFKVEGPKEEVNMGEIMMSHGECVTLTNKLGEAIAWTGAGEDTYTTENPNVAMVVSSNGYACVTNMVHDGAVEVVLETATTKYTYLVRCMTVEIEKTIKAASVDKPSDKSNATIRVTTHVLYGVNSIPTNKILFISSTCSSHGLTDEELKKQANTLATKGAVDYFFYAHANNATDAAKTDAAYDGHLAMSNTLTRTIDVSGGKHYNLKAYLNCLSTKLDLDHKNYDYVVLSFDSAVLGNTYPKNNKDMEADVAAKLRWYYENKRVIWITDKEYNASSTISWGTMDYDTWEGLCAIIDPVTYCTKPAGSRYVSTSNNIYYGTKNTLQADYTKTDATEKMLSDNVKMATYDTELVDNVLNLNNSLTIVKTGSDTSEVHFYTWAGKSAPVAPDGGVIADLPKDSTHWAEEPDSAFKVDPVNYQVTANVSNITMETWNMFEISIVDNGTFLLECLAHDPPLAELDPETGMYTVNPNDGPANVTLYSVEGGKKYEVQSTAKATSVLWPLENPQMFIQLKDASRVYDGIATNVDFIAVTNAAGKTLTTSKLEYSTSETGPYKSWSAAAFTDVTTAPQKVYVRAEATGYVPATNFAFVTITKAKIQTPKPGEEPTDKTKPYTQAPNIKYTYDGTATNIVPKTENLVGGNTATYFYCLADDDGKPTGAWVPEAEFKRIKDVLMDGDNISSNKVFYTVTTDKSGAENYFAATNFAWVTIEPCKITLTAFTYNWPYDGQTHETNKYSMTGSFVSGEGISSVEMDPVNSRITDVGETNNVIVTVNPQEGTKLDNYDIKLVPGKLYVSRVDLTPGQVWAEDAEKVYDGDNNTNIVIRWGDGMDPSKFTVTFAADSANKPDEQRQSGFALPKPSEAPADSEFDESFPGYHDSWTNKVWFRVTEKENYSEGDEKGNYSNYYGYAWVKIAPRPVHFSFPKAVKPYDGTTTGVPLATNLTVATHGAAQQGEDHGMIQPEKFNCTATGSFTGSNVKDAADYFQLESVTIKEGRNTFKRNYVITYDGEADQLVPGEITAVPITPKKPGGTGDNPGEDPADDPTCTEPTIWARNIVKCYDGIGTNIVADVYNEVSGNTFTYEYSTNEIDFVDWDELQFTNVVSAQKVWYRAMTAQGNYLGVTNYAYVTITQKVVSAENGVIADSTNKVYGAAAPDLANHTWTGPAKGALVEGDTIASVGFAWTNDVAEIKNLKVGEYPDIITTNGPNAIVIKNAAGEDVTANYVMGFMPGALTVTQKVLTVTLYDTNKVYGATTPDWTVKNVEGLVGDDQLTGVPGSIVGTEPTDASDTPYQVTVGLGTLDAGGNYTIVVKKPTLTITPAPIDPKDDVILLGGNTPEKIEEYMKGVSAGTLVAFRTEVWTNDVPEVTTVGTNIVVRFKGLTDADTAAATFEWSTTGETGPWSSTEPNFTEICAEQVWCKVTCPNYVATNATSYVYIKSRESKPDDEDAEEEDKLQPNPDPTKPTTEEQTEKVVENIAANDNRLPAGTGPGKYDSSKPAWDGTGELRGDGKPIPQTDAEVNLKVTSISKLSEDEQKKANASLSNEVERVASLPDVDPESVKGRNVDVKLLYTRTYADGAKSEAVNIGGSNTELIPFTIAVELAEDETILKVARYHEGVERPLVSPERYELSADRKYLTIYAKTYSWFMIITGRELLPECVTAFTLKFSGKTASEYTLAKKRTLYKTVQKISGKGELVLSPQVTSELFSNVKVGKKAIDDIVVPAAVNKCTYFGKRLANVVPAEKNAKMKEGKTYSLESDLGLSVVDATSGDYGKINIEQVAFGKVKVKISKYKPATKKGCRPVDPVAGCIPTLTPVSYSGWFTGSMDVGCLDEEAYADECNVFDAYDGIAVFGGKWSAKYSAAKTQQYNRELQK